MAELRIVNEETIRTLSKLSMETRMTPEQIIKRALQLFEDQL